MITVKGAKTELRKGNLTSTVTLLRGTIPTTLSFLEDGDGHVNYVARTEHNCRTRVSTLTFLASYDANMKPLEAAPKNIVLDIEPGSLAEAELNLACAKKEA